MNDTTTEPQDETAEATDSPPASAEEFHVSQPGNINPEVLQNISVNLSIEVGRTNIKIKDLHLHQRQGQKLSLIYWRNTY